MNLSRSLFAVSIVFSAAVTAAACSSSSTPATGGVDSGGSGGNDAVQCATLSACCSVLSAQGIAAATVTQCTDAVKTGGAGCESLYTSIQAMGYCSTTGAGGSGAGGTGAGGTGAGGTGAGGTGGGGTGGGGTGGGGTGGGGTGGGGTGGGGTGGGGTGGGGTGGGGTGSGGSPADGGGGPVSCANPSSTVPVGFSPPTGILGAAGGCTVADDSKLAACYVATSDAGINACNSILTQGATQDGGFGTCGNCVYGTYIQAGQNAPAEWGTNLTLILEPEVGNAAAGYPVNTGAEVGVCVYAAGGTAAHQCGLDLMALDDCVYSSCIGLCAVTDPPAGQNFNAGQLSALQNCFSTVQMGACSTYVTAAHTDCAPYTNTDMTGIYDKCIQAGEQANEQDSGAPAIPNAYQKLIQLSCTGGDAGAL